MKCAYQGGYIHSRLSVSSGSLQTSTHGKVFINRVQVVFCVSFRNDAEELDLAQDLIIKGKIIAGDDIDARSLLDFPMFQPQSLALVEEVLL